MGHGGGTVVGPLLSTPAIQVRILQPTNFAVLEKDEKYQKRPGFARFLTSIAGSNRIYLNIKLRTV